MTNSKIDNSIAKMPGSDATSHFLKASLIPQSQVTPIMAEKMMTAGEILPVYGSAYAGSLARSKTTWTRLAARHNNGGNILFLDGHVGLFTFKELQPTTATGTPGGSTWKAPTWNAAWNVGNKVIWDPYQSPLAATSANVNGAADRPEIDHDKTCKFENARPARRRRVLAADRRRPGDPAGGRRRAGAVRGPGRQGPPLDGPDRRPGGPVPLRPARSATSPRR